MIRTITAGLIVGAAIFLGISRADAATTPRPVPTPENVVFTDYKGVSIGMTTEAVREKLGKPEEKSDAMDLYIFSGDESAQFFYSAEKTVKAIMITYTGSLKKAPTPMAIFGQEAEAGPDGGIFKMVRYPKAGFWISYNRTAGDDAIINIAVQKL